ncbi:MAG TPA: tetratricopeptide repeat protein [Fimbriimonadaceae bacterium]|nr:tetratricopeptide repeat protein [Fimbriimonadaceae bacterium]
MELVIKVVYNEEVMRKNSLRIAQAVLLVCVAGLGLAQSASKARALEWLDSPEFKQKYPALYAKRVHLRGWIVKYYDPAQKSTMKQLSKKTVESFLATVKPATKSVPQRPSDSPVTVKVYNRTPNYAAVRVKVDKNGKSEQRDLFRVTGAGGLAPMKRASVVADRIHQMNIDDPTWREKLEVSRLGTDGKSYVVVKVKSKQGAIVTADTVLAGYEGKSPEALAEDMIAKIESAYGVSSTRSPDLAVIEREKGDDFFNEGKWSEAEVAFREAIAYRSDYPEAYIALAETLMKLHRNDEARQALRDALINCPKQKKLIHDEAKRVLGTDLDGL